MLARHLFKSFIICFLFMNQTLQAQITITKQSLEASFETPVEAVENMISNSGSLSDLVELSGENKTWDFTGLSFEGSIEGTYSLSYDISNLPYADDSHYSEADAAIIFDYHTVDGQPFDEVLYGYLKLENNQALSLGTVSSLPDMDDYLRLYNFPAEVDFEFPATYGSNWAYNYEFEMVMPGTGTVNEQDYSVTVEVDSWGEVITDDGTTEVLRLKVVKEFIASGTTLTETDYRYVDENGRTIAQISIEPSGDIEAASIFTYQTSTSIDSETAIPEQVELKQNYPNPFNPTTQIQFSLPEASHVRIDVYSVNGARVANLVNSMQSAGNHTITFDATHLASGIYIYRMVTNDLVETKKLNFIK